MNDCNKAYKSFYSTSQGYYYTNSNLALTLHTYTTPLAMNKNALNFYKLCHIVFSMNDMLLNLLSGGDRRSIGRANEVADYVFLNAALIPDLIQLLYYSDEVVRMRAADALEKITDKQPNLIINHVDKLLKIGKSSSQQEVHWHIAQIIGSLSIPKSLAKDCYNLLDDIYSYAE